MTHPTKPTDDFLGYAEPLGTYIEIHPLDSPRRRLARAFFNKELFAYFEQLSSGQCGWGLSFNDWLRGQGWELTGFATYKRVPALFEETPVE